MSPQVPDYWPLMEAYHQVREPLYRAILADVLCDLPPNARLLDAGCGDAFYSRMMAESLGPGARIVAVDHNFALLCAQSNSDRRISLCLMDLEQAGLPARSFDAIWLCRAIHSAADPLRRLAALTALLRPGGTLIVIENDSAHEAILPLPADFDHRLEEARYRYLKSRSAAGAVLERYHAARHLPLWLGQVGLRPGFIRTYVSEDMAPLEEEVEAYWRLLMAWQGRCLGPFLSGEDQQAYRKAFDPASPDYLLARPGTYCLELTTVVCGVAPG